MTRFFRSIALALVLAIGSGCESTPPPESAPATQPLPYYAEASFTPHWYDEANAVPDTFHTVAPFALTDQGGRTITEDDLDGRLTIANFFFTACPGICPSTMANMARLQREFTHDDGIVMLSHSITPEADNVAALRDFADRMKVIDDRWHLLTGDRAVIYALGKRSYFADEDLGEAAMPSDADAAFTHTESFFLIDENRRIRGIYNGMNAAAVTQLIADVHTLQNAGRS